MLGSGFTGTLSEDWEQDIKDLQFALRSNREVMDAADFYFTRPHPDFGYDPDERAEAFSELFAGIVFLLRRQADRKDASQDCLKELVAPLIAEFPQR